MSSRDRITAAAAANGWHLNGHRGSRFVTHTKCATHLTVSYTRADQVAWARGHGLVVPARRAAGKADQVIDYLQSDLLGDGPCVLRAMSHAGELMIVEDAAGDVWLVSIYASDKRITPAAVAGFIARDAVRQVDRPFESWSELDDYRRANVRPPTPRFPTYADYTAADVHAALKDSVTAEDPDETALAQTLLEHIVEQALIVRRDTSLHGLVTRRINELQGARAQ